MALKDDLEKAGHDLKDAANEAKHRTTAEAERAKRDLLGDEMTTGEKVKSTLNEGKNRVEADVDKAKREVRDSGNR